MGKIILTGFEPFGPYAYNPVQESTEYFDGEYIGSHEVIGAVLRCTYVSAFEMLQKIIVAEKPDAIIETGLSSSVKGIRFETTGQNHMNGKYPDADGLDPKGDILLQGGPKFLATNGDNAALASLLHQQGIPTEMSADAGGFICNSLLYLTAHQIQKEGLDIKHVFIHTPWTSNFRDTIQLEPEKIMIEQEMLHETIRQLVAHIND